MPPDLFDSVESLSASFLQRRSRLIAAGCALVVVTAVTTAALSFNGADSATRSFTASGAANGATPLPPNSSRVSSVVDPGIPVFLPSYVPAGFEFSSFVTHTAATDTSDLPNEPSTEVTLLNSDGTSLVRFSAIDGGQPNPDIPADREARRVRIGDREGTLIIDSPSALRLVWEYREPGFSMTGEAVGLRADDFIAVAASVVPSRDGNGRPRIQLSRLPAGWYVVDVDADPVDPRWVAVYQRWTTAVGEYVSVTGEAPLSETQIVAKSSSRPS